MLRGWLQAKIGKNVYSKLSNRILVWNAQDVSMGQIDFLREQIEKTGYPLEIEISSILDSKWEVVNTESYFDTDEKKMRDIDIRADKPVIQELMPLFLDVKLVVECKRDRDFAWVFFTRPLKFDWIGDIDGQYLDELQVLTKSSETTQIKDIILGKAAYHYKDMNKVAVCYDEFHLQGKKNSFAQKKKEIFEAQNQLKKYISYTNEHEMKAQYPGLYRLIMYFPCIVFDGQMFEAIVEGTRIRLKRANHILLTTQNRTSYSNWEQGFLIDVVQKTHFGRYLRIVNRDFLSLKKLVKKNRRKMQEEVERILSLYKTKMV